jgi:hypothetical protein
LLFNDTCFPLNRIKQWNDALATEDPAIVANRYAKEAILLPTVSGKLPDDCCRLAHFLLDRRLTTLPLVDVCTNNVSLIVDEPRTTKEGITDYFVNFLKNKPQGVITDGVTLSGPVRV